MRRKEFIVLIEDNLMVLDWLTSRINAGRDAVKYSRQHFRTLLRLHAGGRALLKDIAKHNDVSASNLCMTLRHLEEDGLVLRQVDEIDRRNTWYSLTPAGEKVAEEARAEFRSRISELFSVLDKRDEARLTDALRTMNELLNKMKDSYND